MQHGQHDSVEDTEEASTMNHDKFDALNDVMNKILHKSVGSNKAAVNSTFPLQLVE
jgi:hypothetical protein